ncbi:MAG TPA: contractile injection system protein, VgrG/Pvc8 family [Steroidobacteraceae bacterium]
MLLDTDIGRLAVANVPQPPLYLHFAIFLADEQRSELSDETFRLVQVEGQEAVSTLFEFTLTLHGNTENPARKPLLFRDLLGRRVSFAVARPVPLATGYASHEATQRFRMALRGGDVRGISLFNGIVASFAMSEPGVYKLTMRPALWKLSLANRYRVYKQKNVRDAIREVCSLHGVAVTFRNLDDGGTYNLATARTQDWLQAGESDFEFLQRLMKKAHLYYYFESSGGDHTVVFANDTQYPRIDAGTALRYTQTSVDELGSHQDDTITQYAYEQTLSQSGLGGAFTRQEDAWGQDAVATFHTIFKPVGDATAEPSFSLHKIYQYGVNDQLATQYATIAAQSLQASASRLSGTSSCPRLRAGCIFQAIEQMGPGSEPNPVQPTLDRRWFVLLEVKHQVSLDGNYQAEFVALAAEGSLAQVSLQDTQQGTVLATVVDDGHGQAPNDWRYYSKSNFDPEQSKVSDTGSSPARTDLQGVYVRFATDPKSAEPVWVKLAAHMENAPEIGALVLVARASDESELPEVQNIVEAGGFMTVTPSRWTAETRVGNNYSTAYGDSKSIRYGRDSTVALPSAIEMVENQYATRKFRDVSYSQGAHYSYDTSETGRAGLLSDSVSLGSTYSHSEGAERKSYDDVDYRRSEEVIGNSDSYSTVTGKSYSKSVNGSSLSYSTVQGDSSSYDTIDGARYSESTSNSTVETHSTTRGKSSSYETYSSGRYFEQSVTGDSESLTNISGTDKSTSHIGVTNHNSTIGVSNDNSALGVSDSTGVFGTSTEARTVGNSNQVNLTGVSTQASATGVSAQATATGVSSQVSATGVLDHVSTTGVSSEVSSYAVQSRIENVGVRFVNKNESPASLEVVNTGASVKLATMFMYL